MIHIAVFSLLLLFIYPTLSIPGEQLKEPRDLLQVKENYRQQPQIIGGSIISAGVFEYFVQVNISRAVACGGILVAPDIIMTAGHCFVPGALSIMVNGYNESKSDHLNWHQHFCDVTNGLWHPDYNEFTSVNDIALLKLSSPVYDIAFIQTNFDKSYPSAGLDVTAIGLGITKARSYSQVL